MDNLLTLFNQEVSATSFSYILLFVSFIGGIIASLSPCTLGILPIIVGYIAGYGHKSNLKTFVQMFFFVLGMAVILTSIGILCAIGGKIFLNKHADIGALFLSGIILVMGLNLIGILELQMPVFIKQMPQNNSSDIVFYPFLIGSLFALASTPCSTPILASIMAFASMSANFVKAGLMLFCFALGQGLIIILVGVFASLLKNLKKVAIISETIMQASGILLIITAGYFYFKIFSSLF